MCETMGTALNVMRFTICPIFSLVAGLLRLFTGIFLVSSLLPDEVADFPPDAMLRLAEPYFFPNQWRAASARAYAWLESYDGPSSFECQESQLGSWLVTNSSRHFDVRADTYLGECFPCFQVLENIFIPLGLFIWQTPP